MPFHSQVDMLYWQHNRAPATLIVFPTNQNKRETNIPIGVCFNFHKKSVTANSVYISLFRDLSKSLNEEI
jgi:hypothetical protein